MADYKVAIIGTGNVATNLALALETGGHFITEIYGRDLTQAMDLANRLYETEPQDFLDFSESEAGVFFICVSDNAITQVVEHLILPENAIVVHTAGSVPIDVLDRLATFNGVFYPLQSLSKNRIISFESVPICLEASTAEVKAVLIDLATSISNFVYELNSEERKAAHLAAVFINNFSNHLFALASDIAKDSELPIEIFNALVIETAKKAIELGADAAQTGPAKRGDKKVVQKHLKQLSHNAQLQDIYLAISESIANRYGVDLA